MTLTNRGDTQIYAQMALNKIRANAEEEEAKAILGRPHTIKKQDDFTVGFSCNTMPMTPEIQHDTISVGL